MVLKPKSTPAKWTMTALVATIRKVLCALPDARKGGNNQRYTILDSRFSGADAKGARGRNNASSLFGIKQIPSIEQIRNLLDPVSPAQVPPVFMDLVEPIVADGGLASHRVLDGRLLAHGLTSEVSSPLREVVQGDPSGARRGCLRWCPRRGISWRTIS